MPKLGGSQIENGVFARFWNDSALNNRQVATAIFSHYGHSDVSWEPIRGKLRSKTLQLMLTVERSGGITGNAVGGTSVSSNGSTMAAPPVEADAAPTKGKEATQVEAPVADAAPDGSAFSVHFRFGSAGDFITYSSNKPTLEEQQQEVGEQMVKHNMFKNGFSNMQLKAYSDASLSGSGRALTQPTQFQNSQYVTVTKVIKAG